MIKIKKPSTDDWDGDGDSAVQTQAVPRNTPPAPAAAVKPEAPKPTRLFTPTGQPVPMSEAELSDEAASIKAEAENVTLPSDYKAAMQLYREVLRMPVNSRRDRAFKYWRKKFVGRHIFRLQQMPAAPNTRPAERFVNEDIAIAQASRLRKERLDSLRARIAAR